MNPVAFAVDGCDVSWDEVLLHVEPSRGPRPSEVDFRRARDLTSAADVVTWLQAWDLSLEAWRGWLTGQEPDARVDAVCSGQLVAKARELAEDLAVLSMVGEPSGVHPDLSARAAAVRKRVAAEVGLREARGVADQQRLGWTSLVVDVAVCGNDDVAREVVAWVTHDGLPFARAVAAADVAVFSTTSELDQMPQPDRSALLSAQPGEAVGPLLGHRVLHVARRTPPRAAVARARRLLAKRKVASEFQRRVRWIGPTT